MIKATWKGDAERHRMLEWGGVTFAPGKPETLPEDIDPNILAKMRASPMFEVSDGKAAPHPASAAAKSDKG